MARALCRGRFRSAVDLAKKIETATGRLISPQTIRRGLRRVGMQACQKKKKPALKIGHRQLRLQFARRYESYTIADWRRVIWSDETKVNRFGSDGNLWTWRRGAKQGSVLADEEVQPTHKFGGGSLMLWGCMSGAGVGRFCRINTTMDASLYVEILEGELLDTIRDQGATVKDVIFQQDNDPKHTSKLARECLERLGLEVLQWPPQSPDLNPIEHLWTHLKRQLYQYPKPAQGMEELWVRLQEEWGKIPRDVVLALVDSMPRRIQAVLKAKGGHIKY